MKACVLCPGPSLMNMKGTKFHDVYDIVITVNRAAEAFPCDYWVALDTRTFGMTTPIGHPLLVTSVPHYQKMCLQWPEAKEFKYIDYRSLADHKLAPGWSTKGLLTAVVVGYAKGATVIDCYGVDWKGTEDFDGKTFPGQKRTEKRWEKEARRFETLRKILEKRGVFVTRAQGEKTGDRNGDHLSADVPTDQVL